MTNGRAERGFTLLEALIAFVIASIALVELYHGAVDGLLGSRQAAQTEEAVVRARSRLTAVCHGARLSPGEQTGTDGGGFTWRTEITPVATESAAAVDPEPASPSPRLELFAVRVIVSWPGAFRQRHVALDTRCVSEVPPDKP
jgi:general secretion pathway protein I